MADHKKMPKVSKKFTCSRCNYSTSRRSDWQKHTQTKKHRTISADYLKAKDSPTKIKSKYVCTCGKEYGCRQNLFRHKKKCDLRKMQQKTNREVSDLVEELVKSKDEMIRALQMDKIRPTIVNNLNVYLNTNCPEAMTLTDFLDDIVATDDEIAVTTKDPATGLAMVLSRYLHPLTFLERPLHKINKNAWFVKKDEGWKEKGGGFIVGQARKTVLSTWIKGYKGNSMDLYLQVVRGNCRHLTLQESNDAEDKLGQLCSIDDRSHGGLNILPVGR